METRDFYFELPEELIAQDPLTERSSSRMLVMDRQTGEISHRHFYDVLEYLREGDCLVINDTRVIPARLHGVKKGSGAHAEILLLKRINADDWECLVKPGKKLREGAEIDFGEGALSGVIVDTREDGNRIIHFNYQGIFEEVLDRLGEMPLPPYIHKQLEDRSRYNTVYARHDGSAAAPTAGLHWTEELLGRAREKGVDIAHVTLHVGLGTFRPVKVESIEAHHMHSEFFVIDEENAAIMNACKARGGRLICTGTTSCRTIESAALPDGTIPAKSGWTQIFIYPGYEFRAMDGLITNFHLPESTLIMLVSAFAGRERVLNAYNEAVKERYRFFSFGDASLFI